MRAAVLLEALNIPVDISEKPCLKLADDRLEALSSPALNSLFDISEKY